MKNFLVSRVYHAQYGTASICAFSSTVQSTAVRGMRGAPTFRSSECALRAGVDTGSYPSGWPWVFGEPGRSTELLAEEIFDGFGGLDELLKGDPEVEVQESSDTSRVSREVRNACHSPVSMDKAPAPAVVALSKTGAALTGIPYDVVRAMRTQVTLPHISRKQLQSGKLAATRVAVGPGSSTASAEIELGDKRAQLKHELAAIAGSLTGTTQLRGCQPFASCYGGHQFGNWAGQLGDGRVATLGEIRAVDGRNTGNSELWNGHLIEIQLKGIGKTPFSRGGDGKAVLGACLKEYLYSEAFNGLGIGAAVVVSVCATGEAALIRDPDPKNSGALMRTPGAVLCRIAPSFLRFGSFELPARRGEVAVVRCLADYCLRHLRPYLMSLDQEVDSSVRTSPSLGKQEKRAASLENDALNSPQAVESGESAIGSDQLKHSYMKGNIEGRKEPREEYMELLVSFVQVTARMVAEWQALGFCHGVLNTDNFTLLGLGLDFGHCSFMEDYVPSWSPNEGDSALRYTFQNQPDVAAWNCERLAEAFSSLVGQSGIAEANDAFLPAFDAAYTFRMQRKLGLEGMDLGNDWAAALRSGSAERHQGTHATLSWDAVFLLDLLRLMANCRTDFTDTWRALIDVPGSSEALKSRNSSELDSDSVGAGESHEDMEVWDDECLQPLAAVLARAKPSQKQRQQWAQWIRQYMARIDSQGIGRYHPEGEEEGRRERLEVMRASNPAFILRARALDQAVKAAENGDLSYLHRLEERLATPYHAEFGK